MDSPRDVVAGYRAILFLDLVESCALKARLGEQPYFEQVESPYLEIVRRVLAETPCRERNDTGDGMLLTFDRVEDAVTAALRVQGYLRAAPWISDRAQVRIGIHGGSTRILPGGEIRGNNVDLCARLTSLALPGQVLLTRHAYDEARRFVRGHPLLDGHADRPELVWRTHGSYPFKGFADRCEVCEIGAYGDAPLEAPAMPGAAGTADKALKLVENLGRFVRRHPFITVAVAITLLVVVPLVGYYTWSATQRLKKDDPVPGDGLTFLECQARFAGNDNDKWFYEVVANFQRDADASLTSGVAKDARVAVFVSEPLQYSQAVLNCDTNFYHGLEFVIVEGFLLRGDEGWHRVLWRECSFRNGIIECKLANLEKGDELRIIVLAEYRGTDGTKVPHPSGLRFTVTN